MFVNSELTYYFERGIMWLYDGKELQDEQIPEKSIGFIYLITQKSTGRKYIGRKLLTSAAGKKKVGNRVKKQRKESDWRDYWSSSPDLKEYIKEHGTDDFTREILTFVTSKGSLAAAEEMALYMVGALESDVWWNNNIRSKIYRSWVKPDEMKNLRSKIRKLNLDAV